MIFRSAILKECLIAVYKSVTIFNFKTVTFLDFYHFTEI